MLRLERSLLTTHTGERRMLRPSGSYPRHGLPPSQHGWPSGAMLVGDVSGYAEVTLEKGIHPQQNGKQCSSFCNLLQMYFPVLADEESEVEEEPTATPAPPPLRGPRRLHEDGDFRSADTPSPTI